MIRTAFVLALASAFLFIGLVPASVSADGEGYGSPPAGREAPPRWAKVPFLMSAFAAIWIGIWIYLIIVHRGQQRIERKLDQLGGP